jgi:hypothetical protein
LWRLPKKGFTAPIGEWLRGAQGRMFEDEVLQPQSAVAGYVDRQDLLRRFRAHRRQQSDQSTALWSVWVLERWLRRAKEQTADVALATGTVAR